MIVTTAEEPYNRSDNINSSDSTILVIIFISLLVLKKKTPWKINCERLVLDLIWLPVRYYTS